MTDTTSLNLKREAAPESTHGKSAPNDRALLTAIMNAVDVLIMVLDSDGTIVGFNGACRRLTGYSPKDVVGRTPWDVLADPAEEQIARSAFDKLKSGTVLNEHQWHILSRDGRRLLIAWSDIALLDQDGRVEYIVATGRDITLHEETRDALIESEQRYETVAENIAVGVAVINPQMQILSLNRQMREWFPNVDVADKPLCFCGFNGPHRTEPCSYCPAVQTLRDGKVHESLTETPTAVGLRHYRLISSPILSREGKVIAVVEVVEDVTEQTQAERAVRREREKLQKIFNAAPIGMLLLNDRLVVEMSNEVVAGLTHRGPQELVGCCGGSAIGCLHNAQAAGKCGKSEACGNCMLRGTLSRALDESGGVKGVQINPTLLVEGEQANPWLQISAECIDFEGARHLIVSIEDITRQKQSERALKQSEEKLVQSEKMASIGQLAAGVAHEINNPTGFVMSNLNTLTDYVATFKSLIGDYHLLVRTTDAEARAEILERVDRLREEQDIDYVMEDVDALLSESADGARRIRDIVLNLKSFARVDEEEFKEADINEGIEATLKIVWNELKYKCTVHKELGELPAIQCNPGQLNQVFMNLLVNAAHAIETKGDVTIASSTENGHVVVRVSDTGRGIKPEHLKRIFEPFFTTKGVGKGTGLGLSISHGIVQKHNGTVDVESEVGKGTTFTVRLPITE